QQAHATQTMPPALFLFNDHSVGYPEPNTSPRDQPGGALWQILPFIEQTAAYNSDAYRVPIKTYLEPGRSGRHPVAATAGLVLGWPPASSRQNQVWAMTDYAVNLVALGKRFGRRYIGPAVNPDPAAWTRGAISIAGITDGTSNTILAGQKFIGT